MGYSAYYLLLEDSCATQIGKVDQALLYVSAGSLWIVNDQQDTVDCSKQNHSPLYLKSCELINVFLSCSHKAVLSISEIEFELLLAVDSFAERKKISTETILLQVGRDIYDRYLDQFASGQMCEIFVTIINHPGLPDNTCGLIQYVGSLPSSPGIWFGVKLPFVYRGFGATDGSFKGKRFFECDENCGLFLSVDKISIYHPCKSFENLNLLDEDGSSKSDIISICEALTYNSSASNLARLPLELGERIVWISDDGPELGTVRWIGILPDAKVKEYTIGVEFDKPIGTGTGKYNNEQLFRTTQNHASLVPAIGLMKAEEYFGSKEDVPKSSNEAHFDGSTWNESAPTLDKSNFTEAYIHLSDQSDMGSSGDSASQKLMHQTSKTNNKISKNLNLPGSCNISPSTSVVSPSTSVVSPSTSVVSPSTSVVSNTNNIIIDPWKCNPSVNAFEHCYENVEKDETGRILNRDTNSFQAASMQSDYLEYQPLAMPTPSSFHRSFDNIYAENRKKDKFGVTNQSTEYDRVDSLKSSEVEARHSFQDYDVRSRTLEIYSTTRSVACKVFDENDVPLRLPYTTGRSIFYGRADDESLHADSLNDEAQRSSNNSSTNKTRCIFKFISKRTPNIILQQINKTLRNSLLPQSFHRRSSSDSAPTIPERSNTLRGSLIPFNSSGCSVPCRQDEERTLCSTETSTLPCDIQNICLRTKNYQVFTDASPSTPQTEVITPVSTGLTNDAFPGKFSGSAVTFQPRPSSSMQLEGRGYAFREFDLGSRVEIDVEGLTCYGVVRWMGCFKNRSDILVGLELEEEHKMCTDGKIGGRRFFSCLPGRGYFTFIHSIRKDSRLFPFIDSSNTGLKKGSICSPLCFYDLNSLTAALNLKSSHHFPFFSHADVILFSMFAFSQAFDSILLRKKLDESEAEVDIKRSLLEDIVNPLRCGLSINTSRIECINRLNAKASMSEKESEITSQGPVQFYFNLMQSLNADHHIIFSSGRGAHVWNVPVPEEGVASPSLQRLLELSFFQANIKLSQIPPCLVLHMQKQRRELVIPCMDLDITDILHNSMRECNICGKLGTSECRECFESSNLLSSTMFCEACSNQYHSHIKRSHHRPLPTVGTSIEGSNFLSEVAGSGWAEKFREKLELCAVICSQEFQCVGFTRTGLSSAAPWMFFSTCNLDDESGLVHPQVGICSFLPDLISQSSTNHLIALSKSEIPPLMERFLFNADVYIYQFPSLLLYK